MTAVQHVRDAADFARLFDVSRETVGRLEIYAALLAKWQKTINLVAPSTLGDVWHRHFADSAQVVALAAGSRQQAAGGYVPLPAARCALPESGHWLDLGSGGGFPGLVVGLMLAERGGWRLTLIESDQRKCAFLREVVRETGLKSAMAVDIVAERIESAANHSKVGVVDVVSARALAALPQLLQWARPFFGPEALGVFLKGRVALEEVEAARALGEWAFELVPSSTDAEARVVRVRRV